MLSGLVPDLLYVLFPIGAMVAGLALFVLVGAVLGVTLLAGLTGAVLDGVLAFGVAAMLYLVTEELLVEAHEVPETAAIKYVLLRVFALAGDRFARLRVLPRVDAAGRVFSGRAIWTDRLETRETDATMDESGLAPGGIEPRMPLELGASSCTPTGERSQNLWLSQCRHPRCSE
jgi:hypothetical protein